MNCRCIDKNHVYTDEHQREYVLNCWSTKICFFFKYILWKIVGIFKMHLSTFHCDCMFNCTVQHNSNQSLVIFKSHSTICQFVLYSYMYLHINMHLPIRKKISKHDVTYAPGIVAYCVCLWLWMHLLSVSCMYCILRLYRLNWYLIND